MRTKEEIEAQIKRGEAFIKAHPRSMFGTGNVAQFKLFKRIIGLFQKGKTLGEIGELIEDAYEDEEETFAYDVVDWLRGNNDEDIW